MKKIILPVLAFLLLTAFAFAQKKETRSVDSFTKVSFRMPGKLYLKQGNDQKVELEGNAELLAKIETKVSDGKLIIGHDSDDWKFWKWENEDKVIAYVTVRDLNGLSVSGSGDIIGQSNFKSEELELNVSGSGSMQLEAMVTETLKANVSGSGNIYFKGSCNDFDSRVSGSGKAEVNLTSARSADIGISGSGKVIASGKANVIKATVSGSGEILAAELEVNSSDIRISGAGDVEINVKEELDVTIAGSGSVSYKGNPKHVNSHASGSGRVRKM